MVGPQARPRRRVAVHELSGVGQSWRRAAREKARRVSVAFRMKDGVSTFSSVAKRVFDFRDSRDLGVVRGVPTPENFLCATLVGELLAEVVPLPGDHLFENLGSASYRHPFIDIISIIKMTHQRVM